MSGSQPCCPSGGTGALGCLLGDPQMTRGHHQGS